MADVKTPVYKLGQVRYKYLDSANMAFIQEQHYPQNLIACEKYIDSFIGTIADGTEEAKLITNEFNEIEQARRNNLKQLNEEIKDLGYLEQKDTKDRGQLEIETNATLSRKAFCWTLALNRGLFDA